MRTNVVLDDNLMETALELSGYKTKKEALEAALRLLIDVHRHRRSGHFKPGASTISKSNQLNES
ncbi:MAG: type II toxin-antitoxin system VapB family antitoxin [Sedimentisphaerales bacterium]|nr:type II toxin-antitoxin system VapB family antitoxin [Sedimentisphaerales bacterium]